MHDVAAVGDAAIPHNNTVKDAAYQQQLNAQHGTLSTNHGADGVSVMPPAGTAANIQHVAAPAGPTSTSYIPTYAQNIPPQAAGVVPTAQTAETVLPGQHGHGHGMQPTDTNKNLPTVPLNTTTATDTTSKYQAGNPVPPTAAMGMGTEATPDTMNAMPGQYQRQQPTATTTSNFDGTNRPVA
ncbi:hypothetical protein BG004_005084 [Podila humilis]|nr:hypothetical protein BG004_005084 [Podila humilis]